MSGCDDDEDDDDVACLSTNSCIKTSQGRAHYRATAEVVASAAASSRHN